MHIDLDYSEKPYFRSEPRLPQAVTHNMQCFTVLLSHDLFLSSTEVRLVGGNMEKSRGACLSRREEKLYTFCKGRCL